MIVLAEAMVRVLPAGLVMVTPVPFTVELESVRAVLERLAVRLAVELVNDNAPRVVKGTLKLAVAEELSDNVPRAKSVLKLATTSVKLSVAELPDNVPAV